MPGFVRAQAGSWGLALRLLLAGVPTQALDAAPAGCLPPAITHVCDSAPRPGKPSRFFCGPSLKFLFESYPQSHGFMA